MKDLDFDEELLCSGQCSVNAELRMLSRCCLWNEEFGLMVRRGS